MNGSRAGAAVVLAIALITASLAAPAVAAPPTGGAQGIGDYLFPTLGNPGYDARHYTLDLRYPTAAPAQQISGVVRMDAVATEKLGTFNLDFAGDSFGAITVNGRPAGAQQAGEDIVITLTAPIKAGASFSVVVPFTAHIFTPAPDDPFPFGWFATADGSVTAFQPNIAHLSYPVNDHPADKATYTFHLDMPTGVTAVANGVATGSSSAGGRTVYSYEERSPMASELVQVTVGDIAVIDRGTAAGVALRDVASNTNKRIIEPALARTPTHVRWMVDKVGRYPFENYGVLAADQVFFYALETQTLSLHAELFFDPRFAPGVTGQRWFYEPIMVHELAHQWFGDSIAPERWSDVWLNEGHATWYEREWEQETGQIDENGFASFEAFMRDQYAKANQYRAEFGPVALPTHNDLFGLFSDNVYGGGALVLYALQQKVGDQAFRAIERAWAQRKRGQSVGTDDFITFASDVSGEDLSDFLSAWVYGNTVPPMPGHPDWTSDPVTAATARALSAVSADSVRELELPQRQGGKTLPRY
jgi:aminopeptidase N